MPPPSLPPLPFSLFHPSSLHPLSLPPPSSLLPPSLSVPPFCLYSFTAVLISTTLLFFPPPQERVDDGSEPDARKAYNVSKREQRLQAVCTL